MTRYPCGVAVLLVGVGTIACNGESERHASVAEFVGAEACGQCHAQELAAWQGSDHDRAMEVATEGSVLGDFSGTEVNHGTDLWRFERRDGRFLVVLEEGGGRPQELEILYTFGHDPLQQYLVAQAGGRLQRIPMSWDSRPAEEGGQRWFHVYGADVIGSSDPLHWTRPSQNWNRMCADCHSTGLRRNYDPEANEYRTVWAEIDVSCEACHGPGSAHVTRAERDSSELVADPEIRIPGIQECARCHAHRTAITEFRHGASFLDLYDPSLLRQPLYDSDGGVLEEVFVWGSFAQSRMSEEGVECTDCHEPHTARLRAPGNALCLGCHEAGQYGAASHHFHESDSPGARCVGCHMPSTTFMQVDRRREHRFGTPRPTFPGDGSACLECHADRTAGWASEEIQKRFGPPDAGAVKTSLAQAFYGARRSDPDARDELVRLAADSGLPGILRATALSYLDRYPGMESTRALREHASDPDPLVRAAVGQTLGFADVGERTRTLAPLLEDSVRVVRLAAARALAGAGVIASESAEPLARALAELEHALEMNLDDPGGNVELGDYLLDRGDLRGAEASYRRALELEPALPPAYLNLADLYRSQGREEEARDLLAEGLGASPEAPWIHYSLGLLHVRAGRPDSALEELAQANELAPEERPIGYAYALALRDAGRTAEALRVLEGIVRRRPWDQDVLVALIAIHLDRGDPQAALPWVETLTRVRPDDPRLSGLVLRIRAEAGEGG